MKLSYLLCGRLEVYFVKLQTLSEGRGFDFRWYLWNLHNPSDHTMPLGATQTRTKISSSNISWWVKTAGAQG